MKPASLYQGNLHVSDTPARLNYLNEPSLLFQASWKHIPAALSGYCGSSYPNQTFRRNWAWPSGKKQVPLGSEGREKHASHRVLDTRNNTNTAETVWKTVNAVAQREETLLMWCGESQLKPGLTTDETSVTVRCGHQTRGQTKLTFYLCSSAADADVVSVSSGREERGLNINMLVVGMKVRRFTRVRRWEGWGAGGRVTLGKRLGTFNMTVDKYHPNSRTGKGPEGVVRCFFISDPSGLMIWHHMQHVCRNVAKKGWDSPINYNFHNHPPPLKVQSVNVVERFHILLGRRIQQCKCLVHLWRMMTDKWSSRTERKVQFGLWHDCIHAKWEELWMWSRV